MNSKLLIGGGLVLAFLLGTAATGITTAFNKPESAAAVTPEPAVRASAPVRTRTVVSRPSSFVDNSPTYTNNAPAVKKQRTMKQEVLIVGGSAGAGAAIGAVAGGKKGAAVGAISGGVAGLIYDMATRNK
jgi:hypothetical protein